MKTFPRRKRVDVVARSVSSSCRRVRRCAFEGDGASPSISRIVSNPHPDPRVVVVVVVVVVVRSRLVEVEV